MKNNKTVCFLADQHALYDDRIYWKEALSLIKAGYTVHYITIGDEEGKGITAEGIHYLQLKRKKYLPTVVLNYFYKKLPFVTTEYHEALAYCKTIDVDVYHVHDHRINRILKDLKNIHPKAKFIYDGREPIDKNLKDYRFKDSIWPKILTNAYADYVQRWEYEQVKLYDYIFTVDDGLYHRFKTNVPNVAIENIYNFTNLKHQRENLTYEDKIYDAAYVGGISEIRGALIAVEATKHVVEKFPKYKLLLLGQIFDEKLKNRINDLIAENHLEDNIILKSFVPHQEVSHYFNRMKIGLNPLLYAKAHEEIIQIKLFEYMNFGIPIITSNFGYMQSYVLQNTVGLAVEPNDARKLGTAIIELLSNRELFDQYSANGIKAVDEKYNWDLMENKMLNIYKNTLNEREL